MVGRPLMRLKNIAVGGVLCVALVAAAPAYAQTSVQDGYSQPAGKVQQQLGSGNHERHDPTSEGESGNLPFTGLDVALVVAAGGVLLAMGFGIRRLSRTELA
jgi:hypothetical protein